MSTASEREAALRRALQSAAEYIEPAPGGLERIQNRLRRPRPVLVAWLEAAWTVVMMRAPDVIDAVRRLTVKMLRPVWDRFGPKAAARPGPLRWLRPLTAMSVAVFVVGASVYVGLESSTGAFTIGASLGGQGLTGTHPGARSSSGGGTAYGNGSPSSFPVTSSSPGSTPACSKSSGTAQYSAPPPGSSTSPPSSSSAPATSTGPSTGSTSPSPSDSTTPDPGSSSPSADSGAASDAGQTDAGQTNGNLISAGANAGTGTGASDTGVNGGPARRSTGNTNASQSAAPPHAATRNGKPAASSPKYDPCHTPKPASRHTKKASSPSTATQTSAELGHTQPGRAVAAKLD
jgi:hypothetical protein